MSKLKMFSVYDSKAEVYDKPFCMLTKGECIRGFGDAANDPKTTLGQHPADYTLFEIGEYDQITGNIELHKTKLNLGNALEHKKGN